MRSAIERLVEAFKSRSLPKAEWTHHAHLKVGLWYLLHYSPDESLERLRRDIKRYNIACGVKNTKNQGYHETITQFYIRSIDGFLQQADRSRSLETLATELIDRYGDKLLLSKYYSHCRLMSETARLEWVEPDLMPLTQSARPAFEN